MVFGSSSNRNGVAKGMNTFATGVGILRWGFSAANNFMILDILGSHLKYFP